MGRRTIRVTKRGIIESLENSDSIDSVEFKIDTDVQYSFNAQSISGSSINPGSVSGSMLVYNGSSWQPISTGSIAGSGSSPAPTPTPIIEINSDITGSVMWTSESIYRITSDIEILNNNTILTISTGTIVQVADGVTIDVGPNGGVTTNNGIFARDARIVGLDETSNWRVRTAFYGCVLDIDSCYIDGGSFGQLLPRNSNGGKTLFTNTVFNRGGGFPGSLATIRTGAYGANRDTRVVLQNCTFTNTQSTNAIRYEEVQNNSIQSKELNQLKVDAQIEILADNVRLTNCVIDGENTSVLTSRDGHVYYNCWFIHRGLTEQNTDLVLLKENTVISDCVFFGGEHLLNGTNDLAANNTIRNCLFIADDHSNEHIAQLGDETIVQNCLFIGTPEFASIILGLGDTNISILDCTFANNTEHHIYMNHLVANPGQLKVVDRCIFYNHELSGIYDGEITTNNSLVTLGNNIFFSSVPGSQNLRDMGTITNEFTSYSVDPLMLTDENGTPIDQRDFPISMSAAEWRDAIFNLYMPKQTSPNKEGQIGASVFKTKTFDTFGTTAERPETPVRGSKHYNTSSGSLQIFNGISWV